MMARYHDYIYDTVNRRIIGDFEGAYAACEEVWPTQKQTDGVLFRTVFGLIHDLPRPARVLDVGCGYGYFTAFLHQRGFDTVGIDISPSAIEKGRRELAQGTDLRVGNLMDGLDFPDATFDVILVLGVFWFLLDRLDECLAEIDRLAKPSAWILASIHVPESPINGHIIANYDDFLNILRRRFRTVEAVKIYERARVAEGAALADCITDMVVACRTVRDGS